VCGARARKPMTQCAGQPYRLVSGLRAVDEHRSLEIAGSRFAGSRYAKPGMTKKEILAKCRRIAGQRFSAAPCLANIWRWSRVQNSCRQRRLVLATSDTARILPSTRCLMRRPSNITPAQGAFASGNRMSSDKLQRHVVRHRERRFPRALTGHACPREIGMASAIRRHRQSFAAILAGGRPLTAP